MINPNGCWTCKARRKKCDNREDHGCGTCEFLQITCHRGPKPAWMDGSIRQDEMAQFFKQQVRASSHQRLASRSHRNNDELRKGGSIAPLGSRTSQSDALDLPRCPFSSSSYHDRVLHDNEKTPYSEAVLLSFYLDHVLPFMLPFYRPDHVREGGRAWILELASSSPVIRSVILSQSSYFFALDEGASSNGWEAIVAQSANTFRMLYGATEVMTRTSVQTQLRGAVRMFVGIMQMQRFEVCISGFENCRAHLEIALDLCSNILASAKENINYMETKKSDASNGPGDRPDVVDGRLHEAERAALRMSIALILFDDVISSFVLRRSPRLKIYHEYLLADGGHANGVPLRLDDVLGCPNNILLQMGKLADMNAQICGEPDSPCQAERVAAIRDSLVTQLLHLETRQSETRNTRAFPADDGPRLEEQRQLVAQIWVYTAFLQLLMLTSGSESYHSQVASHVRIILTLMGRLSSPYLLRTLAWPLCIAGSLADGSNRVRVCSLVASLQPRTIYGAVSKAFSIVQRAWEEREEKHGLQYDFYSSLGRENDLPLLV